MSNVAVILCGQVRNYWHTLPYLVDNIIIPNKADVFCLLEAGQWIQGSYVHYNIPILRDHITRILGHHVRFCHFESEIVDLESEIEKILQKADPNNTSINLRGVVSQWTSKKFAFDMVEQYAQQNRKEYDTVLFLRPDVYYEKVVLPKPNPYQVWLVSRCGSPTCCWQMDNFYFGGFDAMKKISRFAYEYGLLPYQQCPTCKLGNEFTYVMEVQFGLYVLKHKIQIKPIWYDIPSRRNERIPPPHPKSENILGIDYPLKYVIDQIKL